MHSQNKNLSELKKDQVQLIAQEEIKHYLEQALAENTKKAYRSDLRHFSDWGGTIPCSDEMVAAYLAAHAEEFAIATLVRRIASISKAHTMKGLKTPTSSDLVKMTMKGIRRSHGKPQHQVSPLLKDDLISMLAHIQPGKKGIRDRALLLIGFSSAMRRSELCAINCTDLEFVQQGLRLSIPRSKTDQSGQGRVIGIPYSKSSICPVKALQEWLDVSGIKEGAVFRAVDKGGNVADGQICTRTVADVIKHYAEKSGLDPSKYSGHSLRSGLVSSAAQQGVSSWVIRRQTGHKSDNMLSRYIRQSDIFRDNASGSLF